MSGYELGTKEPPLPVLLAYAHSVGISTDVLIDDDLDLPDKLPRKAKSSKVNRRTFSVTMQCQSLEEMVTAGST